MKKIAICASVQFLLLTSSVVAAAPQRCATRINAVQTQIAISKQGGNARAVKRQEAALAQIEAHCTEAGQLARAERKRREKQREVDHAQNEIHEAQEDILEAESSGDSRKLAKAQRKLEKKQEKLKEARSDLRDAQAGREALKN
ncbi:DUF1090 family protein [Burkholderia territorii]|uniref:DUF1090 family protein n=1 Tax=Burkholderia territorii TaxID=1503055 RepID=UPI000AD5C9CB|nr:DUF1090 family protein [Burkholderia territorii]